MAMFSVLGVASSGVSVYRKWLDAVSDNIANVNTVRSTSQEAFRTRYVMAEAVNYGQGVGGAEVAGIAYGSAEGRLAYDPEHPLADAGGYVRMPDVDLGSQMTQLIMAQRGYQANLSVVERARDSYSAAVNLGRNQ